MLNLDQNLDTWQAFAGAASFPPEAEGGASPPLFADLTVAGFTGSACLILSWNTGCDCPVVVVGLPPTDDEGPLELSRLFEGFTRAEVWTWAVRNVSEETTLAQLHKLGFSE